MGEIAPLGTRKDGLGAFLDRKLEEGYELEARTDTHAIIFRRPKSLKRFTGAQILAAYPACPTWTKEIAKEIPRHRSRS